MSIKTNNTNIFDNYLKAYNYKALISNPLNYWVALKQTMGDCQLISDRYIIIKQGQLPDNNETERTLEPVRFHKDKRGNKVNPLVDKSSVPSIEEIKGIYSNLELLASSSIFEISKDYQDYLKKIIKHHKAIETQKIIHKMELFFENSKTMNITIDRTHPTFSTDPCYKSEFFLTFKNFELPENFTTFKFNLNYLYFLPFFTICRKAKIEVFKYKKTGSNLIVLCDVDNDLSILIPPLK